MDLLLYHSSNKEREEEVIIKGENGGGTAFLSSASEDMQQAALALFIGTAAIAAFGFFDRKGGAEWGSGATPRWVSISKSKRLYMGEWWYG